MALVFGGLWASALIGSAFEAHPVRTIEAAALTVCTTLPYAAAVLWLDRNEAEPWSLLGFTFAWGALAATTAAMAGNGLFLMATSQFMEPAAAMDLTTRLGAPLVEEATKGIAVAVLFFAFPHDFDNVLDGAIYGAVAGLGFAMVENLFFYVDATSTADMLNLTWSRGVLCGLTGHPTFCALTGIGFGVVRVMRTGRPRWLAVVAGFALAVGSHALWNTYAVRFVAHAGSTEELLMRQIPLAVTVIQLPFAFLVLATTAMAWRHEDTVILSWLEDEKHVVRRDEVLELVPHWQRTLRNLSILKRLGWRAWQRRVARDRALVKLAFAKWHHFHDGQRGHVDDNPMVLRARQDAKSTQWMRDGDTF